MAELAEVVDAEIVDETSTAVSAIGTVAVARRERRSEVLRPMAVDQLVASFQDYQDMLPRLLAESDYQDAGRGQRFVKKSGWRKIAAAFDLDVVLVSNEVERDPFGKPLRARVIARAIAPSGRTMDGDGYCSVDERRFQGGGSDKLENDLRATAATRAKNRAIADLVGMGDVSAEEVSSGDQHPAGPDRPFGVPADAGNARYAAQALVKLCGGDTTKADKAWKSLTEGLGGYMPAAAALAIRSVTKSASIRITNMDDADVPWSTGYQTPSEPEQATMSMPEDDAADATPPPTMEARSEVDQLEDDCLELWSRIDGSTERAVARVTEASGNVRALRALKAAARQAIRRDQENATLGNPPGRESA